MKLMQNADEFSWDEIFSLQNFRYLFYGLTLWNILDHVSMPLIMFYRFHASVCLVDMWNHAYEPKLH